MHSYLLLSLLALGGLLIVGLLIYGFFVLPLMLVVQNAGDARLSKTSKAAWLVPTILLWPLPIYVYGMRHGGRVTKPASWIFALLALALLTFGGLHVARSERHPAWERELGRLATTADPVTRYYANLMRRDILLLRKDQRTIPADLDRLATRLLADHLITPAEFQTWRQFLAHTRDGTPVPS